MTEVANQRVHKTTRERPVDRALLERPKLLSLPERPFDTDKVEVRVVRKDARVPFDSNHCSVPHQFVGKTVFVRADDEQVRFVEGSEEVCTHPRSWERGQIVEDPKHSEALVEVRKRARPMRRRDEIAGWSDEARVYIQELSKVRKSLEHEVRKLVGLVRLYGKDDVHAGLVTALGARQFGARYVRFFVDQSRFARGLGEPPEPIVTGNKRADAVTVNTHNLEDYDALFRRQRRRLKTEGEEAPTQEAEPDAPPKP